MVIGAYIFGSSGFTVHHCCCKKHYHVTCSIINAYENYIFSGCEKHTHNAKIEEAMCEEEGISVIKAPKRHCADILFTINAEEYNNEDNLKVPINFTEELIQYCILCSDSISDNQYQNTGVNLFFSYDASHYRYRPWCTPDILCTFII